MKISIKAKLYNQEAGKTNNNTCRVSELKKQDINLQI